MVFQSLLSTVTTAASSGFIGGTFSGSGSPPESGAASPAKHNAYILGSLRTFDDLPVERSTRRTANMNATEQHRRPSGEVEVPAPTVGWWKWQAVVPTSQSLAADDQRRDGATLYAMEQSLSSWEQDANERLNDWQHAEEVKPIFRTSRNYGTFTRRDFLYSGTACAPARPASPPQPASDAVTKLSTLSGSGASTRPSQSCECASESRHGAEANAAYIEHILRPGDTLSALAVKHQVQVNDIARANGLSGMGSHASLLVRKSLRIPVLANSSQACPAREATQEVSSVEAAKPQNKGAETQPSVVKERNAAKDETRCKRTARSRVQPVGGSYQCGEGERVSRDAGCDDPIAARLASVTAAAASAAAATKQIAEAQC